MKCTLVFILFVFSLVNATAQPNWKDSVKIKEPVLEAYKLYNFIYFKTKKGWGVYEPTQSWLTVQPSWDFIVASKNDPRASFYAVKKNKLVLLDESGKEVKPGSKSKTLLTRIGWGDHYFGPYLIENDNAIFDTRERAYEQLNNFTEHSITLKQNYVLFNSMERSIEPFAAMLNHFGEDSVDVNGNVVPNNALHEMHSGIFDLVAKTWVVGPGVDQVGFIGSNTLVRETKLKDNVFDKKITVYDKTMLKTGQFPLDSVYKSKKAIAVILGDYSPANIEFTSWNDGTINRVTFDSNSKRGIYDPYGFKVLLEPKTYDFLLLPQSFEYNVFTVKNGKVGMWYDDAFDLENRKEYRSYDSEYTKLGKTDQFIEALERNISFVNCNDMDWERFMFTDTSRITKSEILLANNTVKNVSVEVKGNHVIVQDFKPGGFDQQIYVEDENDGHTETVKGEPAILKSGVFDLNSRKWIVPREFAKIMAVENGFSCVRINADTVSLSYYGKDGKAVFKNESIKSFIENRDHISKFSGVAYSGNAKLKLVETGIYMYDGLPLLVNEKGKSGVLDLKRLTWVVSPVNDLVDVSANSGMYFNVMNNHLGVIDVSGEVVALPLFRKFDFHPNEYMIIMDDSLAIYNSYPYETAMADTMKFVNRAQIREFNPDANIVVNTVTLTPDKLFVDDYLDAFYGTYTEWGDLMTGWHKTCAGHCIDRKNYEEKVFTMAIKTLPWKNGFVVEDTSGAWLYLDAKQEVKFKSATPIFIFPDFLTTRDENAGRYLYDAQGNIMDVNVDGDYAYTEGLGMIGFPIRFFDGVNEFKAPKDFYLLAANKSKTGIGYTVTKNSEGQTERNYHYINLATGELSKCDFEFFKNGYVEVMPVKSGFVFLESNYYTDVAKRVWHVEEDLKTIKSSFTKLQGFETVLSNYPSPKYVVYKLTQEPNEMVFDQDFQFLQECPSGAFEFVYPGWNRLILKSAPKTIKMNLAGQILSK